MNQAEDQFARRLVGYLDESVNRIEPATRERLLAARKAALARYRERPAPVAGLAWAGHAAARISESRLLSARHVIAVCALVLALVVIAYWQKPAPVNELADIDTALLSGELPINAYLDKGFDSWLKRSSR